MSDPTFINCHIYGRIRIEKLAMSIIDTPEFQRLRYIKQLGLCYYVFPNANHTRFEHSIGVYHLTNLMLKRIKDIHPNKTFHIEELGGDITLTDFHCELIKIAALCHDIGHLSFGHFFDDYIVNDSTHPNRSHENRSCVLIEKIIKRELSNIISDNHIQFIKNVINPKSHHQGAIYQIVSNKLNGIDVDKFDYLARDTYNVHNTQNFDARGIIDEIIIDSNDNICYNKQISMTIVDMFYTRYIMHKVIYNHETVKIIEVMYIDIIDNLKDVINFNDMITESDKFCQLVDGYLEFLIYSIINFDLFNLNPEKKQKIINANHILDRIKSRKLYKIIKSVNDSITFKIIKYKITYGNTKNPFESIYFYDKKDYNTSFLINQSHITDLVSKSCTEEYTLILSTNESKKID